MRAGARGWPLLPTFFALTTRAQPGAPTTGMPHLETITYRRDSAGLCGGLAVAKLTPRARSPRG